MAEDMQSDEQGMDAKMDPTALVREDVISTIRMLTPITVEGVRDETRDVLFFGEAQIMTQVGALPINFQIEAKTLAEAVEGYGEAAKKGLAETLEKLREMRREAANQIVTPGMPGFQAPPAPGGSGIVMP